MKQKTLIYSLIAYAVVLPYFARLPRGINWALQYIPIGMFGNLATELLFSIFAVIFFGFVSAISAIPMIHCLLRRKSMPLTFLISFTTTTALLVYFHHDYDLAADAQAAVGLVFIPICTAVIVAATSLLSGVVELYARKRLKANCRLHGGPCPPP